MKLDDGSPPSEQLPTSKRRTALPPRGGPLRFHFDFLSPYAYVAWKRIHTIAEPYNREVQPVPLLFAALLAAFDQKGPAEVAPKRVYTFKHAYRLAHTAGIPLVPPPSHPFNPLTALRVASLDMPAPLRRSVIDFLFAAAWAGGGGLEDKSNVIAAVDAAGGDGRAALALASTPEGKERLRGQTDRAIADGVFGVPTVIADGELFWGVDSLPHLDAYLRGEDPVQSLVDQPELLEAWNRIEPSAVRRMR